MTSCVGVCLMILNITRAVSRCVLATILIVCNCIENILKLSFEDSTNFEYLHRKKGYKSFSHSFRSVASQTPEDFIYYGQRNHLIDKYTDVIIYNFGNSERINIAHLNKNRVSLCEEDVHEQTISSSVSIDSTVNDCKIIQTSRNSCIPRSTLADFSLQKPVSEIIKENVKNSSFDSILYHGSAQISTPTSQETISGVLKYTHMENTDTPLIDDFNAKHSIHQQNETRDKDRVSTILISSNAICSSASKLDEIALRDEVNNSKEEFKMEEKQLSVIAEYEIETYSTVSLADDRNVENATEETSKMCNESMEINSVAVMADIVEGNSKPIDQASKSESPINGFVLFEILDREIPKESDCVLDSYQFPPLTQGYSNEVAETQMCSLENLVPQSLTMTAVNEVLDAFEEESKEIKISEKSYYAVNMTADASNEIGTYLGTRNLESLPETNEKEDSLTKIKILDTLVSTGCESNIEVQNGIKSRNDEENPNLNEKANSYRNIPVCGIQGRQTTEIQADSFNRDVADDERNTSKTNSNCDEFDATEVTVNNYIHEDNCKASAIDDNFKMLANDNQQKLCNSLPLFTENKLCQNNIQEEDMEKVLDATLSNIREESSTAQNMDTETVLLNILQSEMDKTVRHVIDKVNVVSDVPDKTEEQLKKEKTKGIAQKSKRVSKKKRKRENKR